MSYYGQKGGMTMQQLPLTEGDRCALAEYGLSADGLAGVVRIRYRRGETLLRERERLPWLLIVRAGKAQVSVSSEKGDKLILSYYLSAGLAGDAELMLGTETALSTMVAVTDFLCVAVPLERNAAALRGSLVFVNRVGEALARKLQSSSRSYMADALHTARERLCLHILQNARDGCFAEVHTSTAGFIGVSYRHLLRLLRQLCEEGILLREGRGYRVADAAALRRLAPK